jgi:hypothetical protein
MVNGSKRYSDEEYCVGTQVLCCCYVGNSGRWWVSTILKINSRLVYYNKINNFYVIENIFGNDNNRILKMVSERAT